MSGPDPRPQAVETAAEWWRLHALRYTPEVLEEQLRSQGYTDAEIREARLRAMPPPVEEPGRRDLRATAAIIVIVAFLGTWAVICLPLLVSQEPGNTGFAGTAAGILAFLLALIGLPTLIVIMDSSRLRRGTIGALVAFLAIPFVLLFVVAGLCLVTTSGMQI